MNPENFEVLYTKARAYKIDRNDFDYGTLLQTCIKLQPSNVVLLTEYHSIRHHSVPREKRRLRPPTVAATTETEEKPLTWTELEEMRENSIIYDSAELADELEALQLDDLRGQCSFVLSLPEKNTIKPITAVSKKLLQVVINASKAIIELEQSSGGNPYYSYLDFCFQLVERVSQLPSATNSAGMLDESYRQALAALVENFTSVPAYCDAADSLRQLQQ